MSFFARHRVSAAVAGTVLTFALASQAVAGPMMVTPSRDLGIQSNVTDVRYVARRASRGGGGAAAAAAFGVLALGVGAAIANSQREQEYYPAYGGYPAYGYGYDYGYQPAPVYAAPPAYYYGAPQPRYNGRSGGTYWQQKARDARDSAQ